MLIKNIIVVVVCLVLFALVWAWWQAFKIASVVNVATYEECVDAGYPILESYPMQCKTPDGRTFVSPVE